MKQAFFITGFNNWGKTTIIYDLFDDRIKYYYGAKYKMSEVDFDTSFTVESHSNDDLGGERWLNTIRKRISDSPDAGMNLFAALCPTMETSNNFITLLSDTTFSSYDKLHIFLIEYKWEHHAKLIIENIINAGRAIPKINFVVINADQNLNNDDERWDAKIKQVRQELNNIFG